MWPQPEIHKTLKVPQKVESGVAKEMTLWRVRPFLWRPLASYSVLFVRIKRPLHIFMITKNTW